MTLKEIQKQIDDMLSEISTMRDEDTLEEALATLDDLVDHLEFGYDSLEYDTDYQEIMENIEDVKFMINEALEDLYSDDFDDED